MPQPLPLNVHNVCAGCRNNAQFLRGPWQHACAVHMAEASDGNWNAVLTLAQEKADLFCPPGHAVAIDMLAHGEGAPEFVITVDGQELRSAAALFDVLFDRFLELVGPWPDRPRNFYDENDEEEDRVLNGSFVTTSAPATEASRPSARL